LLVCGHCGSTNTTSKGDRIACKDCRRRSQKHPKAPETRETFTVNKDNGTATILGNVPENMSEKELVKHFKIDLSRWRIKQIEYGNSQGYRKDRQVAWDVVDGHVVYGKVRDTGKMLIVNLVSVKILLVEKTEEIKARNEVELIKKEAIAYAPKYKLIKRPKVKDGLLYEIMMPDLHLGRLVDADETGHEASPDLFVKKAERAIEKLLHKASLYPVERFLFPIGNDFFNTNNSESTTAHGTIQREDPRWQRTYSLGKRMIIQAVETMTQIAPVDVLIVKGNHDEERIWYFGDTLASWFHANPNVTVDNRAMGRKPYAYGSVFWLFAHGYYEREDKADTLMSPYRDLWAKSKYREVHLGDKHHKREVILKTQELTNGVVVRVFRSLADPSVWEFDKGFDGSLHAAEGLLWHKETGLEAQFPAAV
jgi:DNA-directed RNA polymerase subunit RPC12/RpoP